MGLHPSEIGRNTTHQIKFIKKLRKKGILAMTQKNSSLNLFHRLRETSHSLSQSHYIALKVGQALVADEDLVKDISFSYTLSCVCLKKWLLK